jgi:hypothetical protein
MSDGSNTFPKSRVGDLFKEEGQTICSQTCQTFSTLVSPRFHARLNNCRRQHGALSRSSSSPFVVSLCFLCTCEPCVRKACGGGLPKPSRNHGDLLKARLPRCIVEVGSTVLSFSLPVV